MQLVAGAKSGKSAILRDMTLSADDLPDDIAALKADTPVSPFQPRAEPPSNTKQILAAAYVGLSDQREPVAQFD